MSFSKVLYYGKFGMETFLSSILFFYSHLSLLFISLLPSFIRAYQMWVPQTPMWVEAIVELTRVILFLLIISLMTKSNVKNLKQKEFWNRIIETCSVQMKNNWPYGIIAQIFVFLALLFGAGNLLIKIIVSGSLITMMELLGFKSYEYTAAHDAFIFFLKNMSVIPLALVYIIKMCGVRPTKN